MNFMKKFLILIFITSFLTVGVHAATVSFSPSSLSIGNSDTFIMELIGSDFNAGSLDGGGVNINFDPAVINVTNVTIDTGAWEFFSTEGAIDNIAGTIEGLSFNSFQTRTGDLLFATIEFTAVGFGATTLGLTEYELNPFATGGSLYSGLVLDQSVSVTVQAVPVPAAVWLFISGLGLLATQRRILA